MTLQAMYPALVNSPFTELASAIDHEQTTIEVLDGSKLPDAPNIATIGTGEDAETILYAQKDGNVLSEVTRGFQATPKAWGQGTSVARMFTAYDYDTLRINLQNTKQELDEHKAETVADDVHGLLTDGKIIEESGSNANGRYIKFADGTFICYHTMWLKTGAGTEISGTWVSPFAYPDPAVIQRPYFSVEVAYNHHYSDHDVAANRLVSKVQGGFASGSLRFTLNFEASSGDHGKDIALLLIGRWK